MTIRDYLNRKIVIVFVIMMICLGSFVLLGILASSSTQQFELLAFLPFFGVAVCILCLYYAVRCPKCHNAVAYLTYLPGGGIFRLSKKVKFCPFCGVAFDNQIEETKGNEYSDVEGD